MRGARRRDHLARDALRAALIATGVVFLVLVALCAGVDLLVQHSLRASLDDRLSERMATLQGNHDQIFAGIVRDEEDRNNLEEPVLYWAVDHGGNVVTHSAGAPPLPAALHGVGSARDTSLGGVEMRISGLTVDDGRVVTAISTAPVSRALTSMLVAEGLFIPVVLGAVFLGATAIGYRVAGPVEQARQRHVAFTADASHELRTPLAVIEAETSLALSAPRDAAAYREALERVSGESGRLRRIVDDLLWLARFDDAPEPPHAEPVDVGQVAAEATERFRTMASTRGLLLRSEVRGERAPLVTAPADWMDRLCGVLLDNACKYSPPGGEVQVVVEDDGNSVALSVRDHGPGVPAEERTRIFDRFRRATDSTTGAGLGLAIGDAVVRATGGHWDLGDTPGGGATFTVTWPRSAGGGVEAVSRTAPTH